MEVQCYTTRGKLSKKTANEHRKCDQIQSSSLTSSALLQFRYSGAETARKRNSPPVFTNIMHAHSVQTRALLQASLLLGLPALISADFSTTCPSTFLTSSNATLGVCPQDFTIIGGELEAVHESVNAPTGLAVDADSNVYLTYPRNAANLTNNVVICTSFTDEEAWPNAEIQQCQPGQNVSECFINVRKVPQYEAPGEGGCSLTISAGAKCSIGLHWADVDCRHRHPFRGDRVCFGRGQDHGF